MKKIFLLLVLIVCLNSFNAQITLDNTYSGSTNITLVKLHVSGYKYIKWVGGSSTIQLYNVNHSLFKTMTVPTINPGTQVLSYVSENLFDTDNMVEYVMQTYSNPGYKVYIFKENGTLLISQDSAVISQSNSGVFGNQDGIFFDGLNTKMKLTLWGGNPAAIVKHQIYTLPGSIPCIECSASGTVVGISSPGATNPSGAVFYPNPVTDQLKLKYELPKDYNNAEIMIYDLQGKLIETFKVTDTFDFIYLPSDYNNGLYLYSLNVDGKTIKTEKIILNK